MESDGTLFPPSHSALGCHSLLQTIDHKWQRTVAAEAAEMNAFATSLVVCTRYDMLNLIPSDSSLLLTILGRGTAAAGRGGERGGLDAVLADPPSSSSCSVCAAA